MIHLNKLTDKQRKQKRPFFTVYSAHINLLFSTHMMIYVLHNSALVFLGNITQRLQ